MEKLVEFTDHIVTTTKPIINQLSTPFHRKTLRIILNDPYATDSSDDEGKSSTKKIIKRHIHEINFKLEELQEISFKPEEELEQKIEKRKRNDVVIPAQKKFRGVRQRPWGRWAAEIRDPNCGKRIWLGTYDTAKEAALVYDSEAVRLKGESAIINFPNAVSEVEAESPAESGGVLSNDVVSSPTSVLRYEEFNHAIINFPKTVAKVEVEAESTAESAGVLCNDVVSSPTSVLRYEEFKPFDGLDFDFGFPDVDWPLDFTGFRNSSSHYVEEFGEFDFDDFMNDLR